MATLETPKPEWVVTTKTGESLGEYDTAQLDAYWDALVNTWGRDQLIVKKAP